MKSPGGWDRKRGERNVNLIYKKNEGSGERRGGRREESFLPGLNAWQVEPDTV